MAGSFVGGSSKVTAVVLVILLAAATASIYAVSDILNHPNPAWNEGSNAWYGGENHSWDGALSRNNFWSEYSGTSSYVVPDPADSAGQCPSVFEQLEAQDFFASRPKCGPEDYARGFVSTDVDGPSLRYYLRRYHDACWDNSFNLSLELFAEDPSGVDQVVMMSSYDGDVSQNVTMVQDATNPGRYTSHLLFPANSSSPITTSQSPYDPYQEDVYVKYAANDTLGNWACTGSCTYQVAFSSWHVDGVPIELYDTADLWYLPGTTGHTITWAVLTGTPDHYTLTEDSHLIEEWSWTGPLTIAVDGLSLGSHVFFLGVSQGWAGAWDSVTVHVVEQLPAGYFITTVGPLSGHIQSVLALGGGLTAAFVVAIVIGLVKWRRRIRKNAENQGILSNPTGED